MRIEFKLSIIILQLALYIYTKMVEAGAIIIGCPCTSSTDEEGCMHVHASCFGSLDRYPYS